VIALHHLTKKFGDVTAVNDLTFDIAPGVVTGFLGPNGSGKSTTMKLILGLLTPTSGTVMVNGQRYRDLKNPLREVGALLDAKALHPGRTARHHLSALALSNKIPLTRVDEVLEIVGLTSVADKRAGQFSLGMGQRLGIAGALLGDPGILLFDEPVNGLDPEGIRWVREFFRGLAQQGRTVLVSSHLMAEMQQTADTFIVVGKGRLITHGTESQLAQHRTGNVRVRPLDGPSFANLGAAKGWRMDGGTNQSFTVFDVTSETIGRDCLAAGIALAELTPSDANLEDIFIELTASSVEYSGRATEGPQ
jgi:ABC-2 type transport system ATP-binding protein